MKVIGIETVNFNAKDGTPISGKTYYFTEPITAENSFGMKADKAFFSDKKLANFAPVGIGDNVVLLYNKYGKPEAMLSAEHDNF